MNKLFVCSSGASIRKVFSGSLIGVLTALSNPVAATDIYVSFEGDDKNPGTLTSPFRSITHAVHLAQPGDTIHVGPGVYEERIVFPRSGRKEAPIVVVGVRDSTGSWKSIVDGSEPTTGWVDADDVGTGIFKAQLGYEARCMIAGDGDVP